MKRDQSSTYVLNQEEMDSFGSLVDYLAGLESLIDPGNVGGSMVRLQREHLKALIEAAHKRATEIYCAVLDRNTDQERAADRDAADDQEDGTAVN